MTLLMSGGLTIGVSAISKIGAFRECKLEG